GQMKISEQSAGYAKLESRVDEEVCFAPSAGNRTLPGRVLEGADSGCTYGDDSRCGANRFGGGRRDLEHFVVHSMLLHHLGVNRLKRSQTDVQGNLRQFGDASQNFGREMQTRRR